jgi:hypothetical protein
MLFAATTGRRAAATRLAPFHFHFHFHFHFLSMESCPAAMACVHAIHLIPLPFHHSAPHCTTLLLPTAMKTVIEQCFVSVGSSRPVGPTPSPPQRVDPTKLNLASACRRLPSPTHPLGTPVREKASGFYGTSTARGMTSCKMHSHTDTAFRCLSPLEYTHDEPLNPSGSRVCRCGPLEVHCQRHFPWKPAFDSGMRHSP